MPVRSTVLGRGTTGAAATNITAYTVPAGFTAILKDIRVTRNVGGDLTVNVVLVAGQLGVLVINSPIAAAVSVLQHECWCVLEPGNQIQVSCSLANGVRFWLSGAELPGVA